MNALFFLFAFAVMVAGGPVSTTSCPTQCYTAVNECNMSYGGCWEECPGSKTEIPTFTRPICSAAATTSPVSITTPPEMTVTPAPTPTKTDCIQGQSVCVDAWTMCGNTTVAYGRCFDACATNQMPSPPACTLASVGFPGGRNMTLNRPTGKKPPRPKCTRKAFLCPPADW